MIKAGIVEALGEAELLLPDRLNRGLVANDRVKYYLTLLQAADRHATQPHEPASTLRDERKAAGLDDEWLDGVIEQSRAIGGDVFVPAAREIMQQLFSELDLMLQPLRSAQGVAPDLHAAVAAYAGRLGRLRSAAPSAAADRLPSGAVDALTRGGDAVRDSVHQLTMDVHRELNRLQGIIADEVIDGAHTYDLGPGDRALVAAFMKGVAEAAPLTLDHPGLGTTATRVRERLTIQNDIGTTGAHVVVIHVAGATVTITYTDVHRHRVAFLREMLAPFAVEWRDSPVPADAAYTMAVGHFTARHAGEVAAFLTFFGSRLPFLIDWNRARKRLARLASKSDADALLRWSTEHGVGHCGFLRSDGPRLVAQALEAAVPRLRGAPLSEVLGREGARTFLTGVLRITSEGQRAGRSAALIRDEVQAELLRQMQPEDSGLIGTTAEHAMYIFALIERLRRVFVRSSGPLNGEVARTAELATLWESRADEIVRRWNSGLGRTGEGRVVSQLLGTADDVVDALEDAAYLLTLVPHERVRAALAAFDRLPELVSRSAKEYVRCLGYAQQVGRTRVPSDVDAVLVAVDRIATLEHQCDAEERAAEARLLQSAPSFRDLHVLSRLVSAFEEAADALAGCAVLVKDYVLSADGEAGRAA